MRNGGGTPEQVIGGAYALARRLSADIRHQQFGSACVEALRQEGYTIVRMDAQDARVVEVLEDVKAELEGAEERLSSYIGVDPLDAHLDGIRRATRVLDHHLRMLRDGDR